MRTLNYIVLSYEVDTADGCLHDSPVDQHLQLVFSCPDIDPRESVVF